MREDFDRWRKRMASAEPGERADAARLIPVGSDDEVIELLLGALRDAVPAVRAHAAVSLRRFSNEERIEEALGAVVDGDPDYFVRAYALSSLAEMAGPGGYGKVLERWARESDPRLKPRF